MRDANIECGKQAKYDNQNKSDEQNFEGFEN